MLYGSRPGEDTRRVRALLCRKTGACSFGRYKGSSWKWLRDSSVLPLIACGSYERITCSRLRMRWWSGLKRSRSRLPLWAKPCGRTGRRCAGQDGRRLMPVRTHVERTDCPKVFTSAWAHHDDAGRVQRIFDVGRVEFLNHFGAGAAVLGKSVHIGAIR